MSSRGVSSPRDRPGSATPSRPTGASKTLLNEQYIHRIVIGPSAGLGSFYDARIERVLEKLPLGKTPIVKTKQHKAIDCTIMKVDMFDSESLFRQTGIQDELWLNTVLNIIPSEGIAAVVNYSFPKSVNTRILYYYYSSEEQATSPFQNVVRTSIPKAIPNIPVTHVVCAMKVGIQALIVLQLSANDQTDLDCLLKNIAQQLITNKFEVTKDEKFSLDRIAVTKIFSNIPDLYKMSTLAGICQKITSMKPHTYCHLPIEFTLRPIQWFYPLYPMNKAKYILLQPECIKLSKEYLLSLSTQIEELKAFLNPQDQQTIEERLGEQYDAFRQQLADAEKMYSDEIERIRNLVIQIHDETINQELVIEMLIDTMEQSRQSKTDPIMNHSQPLREKEQLLKKSNKQNVKYVDKHQHSSQQPMNTNEQSTPMKLPPSSTSQVTTESNEQSKEVERPSFSSKELTIENTSSRTDSLNGVEQPSLRKEELSKEIERKRNSLRSGKITTSDNQVLSNEQINDMSEGCNGSKSSIVSPPPVGPRVTHKGSNSNNLITPTTPVKLSAVKRVSRLQEQSDCSGEHDNLPNSSPLLALHTTQSLKQQPVDNQERPKSSNFPTSIDELSHKISRSRRRSASAGSSNTKGTSSIKKQPTNVKEQRKPKSPTIATYDNSLASNEQNEDNKESLDSSISPRHSGAENTLPRVEKLASPEDPPDQPKSSTPQPPPVPKRRGSTQTKHPSNTTEPSKSSTTESRTLLNQQSDAVESPNTLTSQLTPRKERKVINDEDSLTLPVVRRASTSKKIPNYLNEHDSVSNLAPDAIHLPNDHPEGSEELPKSPGLSTSAPKTIQSSNKQSETIREPFTRSTPSNLLDSEEISSQSKQGGHSNQQHTSRSSSTISTSDINLTVNQKNRENSESLHSSISSKRSDIKSALPGSSQFVSVENPTNRSRSQTPSDRDSPARQNRRYEKAQNQLNTPPLIDPSTTENTTLLHQQINDEERLESISNVPKILTPRAGPQIKQECPNIEEPLETSTTKRTPSPIELSNGASDGAISSTLQPILSVETPQRTETQQKDTEEKVSQQTSSQPFSAEPTSTLEQQSNNAENENEIQPSPRPATPTFSPRKSVKYKNVLLLGESGVGKSTFINALLNYHAFENLEQARSNQPLVAMPVSFLMTDGDNFEEKIIRFGDVDTNEDHNHPGQSVTQHCRSYVFKISTHTKLRIIDTPGMGDTRGLEQDDLNMQHILSFINNLSHLNAICILLKPNESRLTIVLRCYFTRLLNFLGESARHNIVFCFTNTRATFFAPGNTGPLLKKMINELPIKGIPFEKRNTFCFDSEAFRYLMAIQRGIKFDSYQENEYQQSWTNSSAVSHRLLQYICEDLKPYLQNEWQSTEHTQFKLNQLIRPLMETMRNLCRNITLLKEKSSELIIKLCPVVLSPSSAVCHTCPRTPKRFSDFWILPDDVHTFAGKCSNCDCSKKKHIDVDYKLDYELIPYQGVKSFKRMKSDVNQLREAILEISEFYGYVVDSLKQNDPMLSAMKQIIAEESQICSEKGLSCLNSTLRDIFTTLKEEYIERRATTISVQVPVDLSSVYELIKIISGIDEINEQMHVIKKAQQRYLKQHEKHVF